jgi:signal transduction histidine kinase
MTGMRRYPRSNLLGAASPAWRPAGAHASGAPQTAARQGGFIGTVEDDCTACATSESAARKERQDQLAMLAHELRGPLGPIVTAAHLLARLPGANGRARRAARIIERQAANLVALVNDLLDVARSGDPRITLRPRPALLREIIETAVEAATPAIAARRHALVVEPNGLGETVLLDPLRVVQIVSNLLINAAKYTAPGGRIVLRVSPAQGELVLSVIDNGIGIPSAEQLRLFDLYAQVPGPEVPPASGFGIGLAVVRTLAELHGGTVSVDIAGSGAGSAFTVRLPLPPVAPAAATVPVRATGRP